MRKVQKCYVRLGYLMLFVNNGLLGTVNIKKLLIYSSCGFVQNDTRWLERVLAIEIHKIRI